MSIRLKIIKNFVLDLFFPAVCAGCGKEGGWLCGFCQDRLFPIPPSCIVCRKLVPESGEVSAGRTCRNCRPRSTISAFFSPFLYDEPTVQKLVHGLKYRRVREYSKPLGGILGSYLGKFAVKFPPDPILIPIPLHYRRERIRGFNQALLIATELIRFFPDWRIEVQILERKKNTRPQVEFKSSERQKNMVEAFWCKNPSVLKDRNVILLDDVKTTGATLEEAASALKKAGAKKIWAITVAH